MFEEVTKASELVISKFEQWGEQAISMLPNALIAILVVLIFYVLSRLVKKVLDKLLHQIMHNESALKLVLQLSTAMVMLFGLIVALNVLQLEKTVTSVLAGLGVLGLVLGIAFQDAAANFISGVAMAIKSPINIGDIVESNDIFGTVKHIGLRATTIYDPQGQDVIIPNRLIYQRPYKHYTINAMRRIDLEVGISYGDDLDKVETLSTQAIEAIPYLKAGKKVEFFYTEFGDSSINFVVRYWVDYYRQPDYLKAVSDGIKNLKKAYNENDITIPFPIRTMDFSIKGGQKLDAMLKNSGWKKS
jgi:small conductance mechanosensitive channel